MHSPGAANALHRSINPTDHEGATDFLPPFPRNVSPPPHTIAHGGVLPPRSLGTAERNCLYHQHLDCCPYWRHNPPPRSELDAPPNVPRSRPRSSLDNHRSRRFHEKQMAFGRV